ncbi:TPA: hypothetical protein DDW35_09100 [Candidatus Sumerlaeota bacterium]|jgi:C1A family cysteine protease|nr:hypothetical protein [Candidatus Sumerlaeota bacterium]
MECTKRLNQFVTSSTTRRPFFRVGLLGVALSLFLGSPWAAAPQMAPLNPAFVQWQAVQKASATSDKLAATPGHPLGYCPSPVDWSRSARVAASTAKVSATDATDGTPPPIPSSFDLRTSGTYSRVTSVKDQGAYGTCWAFASFGILESNLLVSDDQTWDFSEGNMVRRSGFDYAINEGGNYDMSTAVMVRGNGPLLEATDPYANLLKSFHPTKPVQKYVTRSRLFTTTSTLKTALMTYGACGVYMYWANNAYRSSDSTYYYSGGTAGNHAVTLVGWDDNKATAAPTAGAWLIKNSWGDGWGKDGYFWLSYSDSAAVFKTDGHQCVTFETCSPSTYSSIYQYDPLGCTASWGDGSSTVCSGANVFTSSSSDPLAAVGFYAMEAGAAYQITIYDNTEGGSAPIFSHVALSTFAGTVDDAGYVTVSLPEPVYIPKGKKFSVVIRLENPSYEYPLAIEGPMTQYIYSSKATAKPGQSFYCLDGGVWSDMTSASAAIVDCAETNVCIKALTVAPPAVSKLRINNGAAYVTTRTVTLNNTYSGNSTPYEYIAAESADFTVNSTGWQTYSPAPTFTLSKGNGTKNVYFKTRLATDGVGLGTESAIKMDTIKLAGPVVTKFVINSNADETTSLTVTLNNTCTGKPAYYMASESSEFTSAEWLPYSTKPRFTLSSGNGTKTVYFKVMNDKGMESLDNTVVSDYITLNEVWLTSFRLNNGDVSTNSSALTLNYTLAGSATDYMVSESSSFKGATTWQAISGTPTYTLKSVKNGTKKVYFKVRYSAWGPVSNVLSDTIVFDSSLISPGVASKYQGHSRVAKTATSAASTVIVQAGGAGNATGGSAADIVTSSTLESKPKLQVTGYEFFADNASPGDEVVATLSIFNAGSVAAKQFHVALYLVPNNLQSLDETCFVEELVIDGVDKGGTVTTDFDFVMPELSGVVYPVFVLDSQLQLAPFDPITNLVDTNQPITVAP